MPRGAKKQQQAARAGKRRLRSSALHSNGQYQPPEEETPEKTLFCRAFATYIRESSAAIDDPFFYLIRGKHKKSLYYHTMFNITHFSALLIACGMVICKRVAGGIEVSSSEETWINFLNRYHLDHEYDNCSEATRGEFLLEAIPNEEGESNTPEKKSWKEADNRKRMVALRIGKYREKGESIKATAAINNGVAPPGFSPKLRTAQRKFFNSVAPEFSKFIFHEHISAVEAWVEMREVYGDPPSPTLEPATPERGDSSTPAADPSVTPSPTAAKSNEGMKSPPNFDQPPSSPKDSSRMNNIVSFLGYKIEDGKQSVQMTPRALDLVKELEKEMGCAATDNDRKMPAQPTTVSPQQSDKRFDLLSKLGIDVMSRTDDGFNVGQMNSQNLLRQLIAYIESKGEVVKYETTNSVHEHLILKISKRKKDGSNPNISDALNEVFTMGDRTKLIGYLLDFLLDNHKEDTLEMLREKRLIPKVMNEYMIAATMDYANIYATHWKKLVHCLKTFQDVKGLQFSSEDKVRRLGGAHVNIHADVYHHPKAKGEVKECIKYWYKDPSEEFVASVESIINGEGLDPSQIAWIHHCAGGDHADVKFRFLAKTIVKTIDGKYHVDIYSLGDVGCKKDTGEILNATILPAMVKGMNDIAKCKLIFEEILHEDEDEMKAAKEYRVELVESVDEATSTGTVINPNSFLTGDLAFLAVVLGKEGFEGWWCCFCKGFRTNWQNKGATFEPWTMSELVEQALKNTLESLTGADRMGVKTKTELDDGVFVIYPGLHGMLGIGNQLLNYFCDILDRDIEPIDQDELLVRESVHQNESLLEEEKINEQVWADSIEGGLLLLKLQEQLKELKKELTKTSLRRSGLSQEAVAAKKKTRDDVDDRIKAMKLVLSGYGSRIKEFEKRISNAKEKVQVLRKARKRKELSLYNRVENVLKKYNIKRGAYHGGDLNGVNIIRLMNDATSIMEEIYEELVKHKRPTTSEDSIKKVCDDVRLALQLWSRAFSMMNTKDPSDTLCDETQATIDLAMEQMYRLELPVSPKAHGMACHLVHQMRTVDGGVALLLEYWVEHYHQVAHKYDVYWRGQTNIQRQATIRARMESMFRQKGTKDEKARVVARFTKVRKRKCLDKTIDKKKKIKSERDDAVNEMMRVLAGAGNIGAMGDIVDES